MTDHMTERPASHPGDTQTLNRPGYPPTPDHRPRGRPAGPGAGVVAAILVAALAVGGVAGVVGAAGFTAVDDLLGNGSSGGSTSSTSSPVVNQKQVAPA